MSEKYIRFSGAFAQRSTKLDLDLLRLTQSQSSKAKQTQMRATQSGTPKTVSVVGVLKDGMTLPEAKLKALGITIEDNTYGIVDMRVPVDKLLELFKHSSTIWGYFYSTNTVIVE